MGPECSDPQQLREIAEQFQSLGHNCEFGLFQRRSQCEALGLLRFSSISMRKLLLGIRTGFSGIDDAALLQLPIRAGEYWGKHAVYGLYYHTFKKEGVIDLNRLLRTELGRLSYLARMLMEQIERSEKIFVVQRSDPPLLLREVLPLLQEMRRHNSSVPLLWVTEADEADLALVGRVETLGDRFYHGYIDRLAPVENAHDLSFECWASICSAVVAEESRIKSRDHNRPVK
jgi:hypothetical protein